MTICRTQKRIIGMFEWYPWFAWYPVPLDVMADEDKRRIRYTEWVWWEWVETRLCHSIGEFWHIYRRPE